MIDPHTNETCHLFLNVTRAWFQLDGDGSDWPGYPLCMPVNDDLIGNNSCTLRYMDLSASPPSDTINVVHQVWVAMETDALLFRVVMQPDTLHLRHENESIHICLSLGFSSAQPAAEMGCTIASDYVITLRYYGHAFGVIAFVQRCNLNGTWENDECFPGGRVWMFLDGGEEEEPHEGQMLAIRGDALELQLPLEAIDRLPLQLPFHVQLQLTSSANSGLTFLRTANHSMDLSLVCESERSPNTELLDDDNDGALVVSPEPDAEPVQDDNDDNETTPEHSAHKEEPTGVLILIAISIFVLPCLLVTAMCLGLCRNYMWLSASPSTTTVVRHHFHHVIVQQQQQQNAVPEPDTEAPVKGPVAPRPRSRLRLQQPIPSEPQPAKAHIAGTDDPLLQAMLLEQHNDNKTKEE